MSGNAPFVRVELVDRFYAEQSPYAIIIEATLGTYKVVLSEPLYLFIYDPCLSTVLVSQNIPTQSTVLNAPQPKTYLLPVFQDSVSLTYS